LIAPEKIWAYCDVCRKTQPVNGAEVREYLTKGSPHTHIDLICSVCYNIIATISIGPPDGTPPVDPLFIFRQRKRSSRKPLMTLKAH